VLAYRHQPTIRKRLVYPNATILALRIELFIRGNGKYHSRTGHEGLEGEKKYSSTLPLTSAISREGYEIFLSKIIKFCTRHQVRT